MNNYSDKGAAWLYSNKLEVIADLSLGNPGAAKAMAALMETREGPKALKGYLELGRVNLTPDEIWDVYNKCCKENADIFATTVELMPYLDPGMLHANIRLDKPVAFVAKAVKIPDIGPARSMVIVELREGFVRRYRIAKAELERAAKANF